MSKQSGFTLIELLITVVIAGIMLSLAVPSFKSMVDRNQALSTANDLLGDIQLARSEAIKLDTLVTVCSSNNRSTCSGSWKDGWIIILADDTVISSRDSVSDDMNIVAEGALDSDGLIYNGTGRRIVKQDENFTIEKGDYEYTIAISLSGRPSVKAH